MLKKVVKRTKKRFAKQLKVLAGSRTNVKKLIKEKMKMTSKSNKVKKQFTGKVKKERKQKLKAEAAGGEVGKGKKLTHLITKLENHFTAIDKNVTKALSIVDKELPPILDAAKQINVILTSFTLKDGKKIPPADVKTLAKYGNKAEVKKELDELQT